MRNLNLGCGHNKIPGCLNVDCDPALNPDKVVDVRETLPFENASFDQVLLFHTIEHLESLYHPHILSEIHRVLIPGGRFYISYPEFLICAGYYAENHRGLKDYWKQTIYGLQRTKSDYHVSLMDSDQFTELLIQVGFKIETCEAEPGSDWNTLICALKDEKMTTYKDIVQKELLDGK